MQYVVRNGGSFNACTSGEFTTFFFDVACDSLRGALDRSVKLLFTLVSNLVVLSGLLSSSSVLCSMLMLVIER